VFEIASGFAGVSASLRRAKTLRCDKPSGQGGLQAMRIRGAVCVVGVQGGWKEKKARQLWRG